MEFDSNVAAEYAGAKLDSLLQRAHRDTVTLADKADIPPLVKHFDDLRERYRSLKQKLTAIEKEVEDLSYTILPNMFQAQHVKTISVEGVGRVTINDKWAASILDKEKGYNWLRSSGNASLIIETVNSSTLTAFAKDRALRGDPLPGDIFKVGAAPYTSITKA